HSLPHQGAFRKTTLRYRKTDFRFRALCVYHLTHRVTVLPRGGSLDMLRSLQAAIAPTFIPVTTCWPRRAAALRDE
ncbi:MAG: hypothetical protein ACRDR6_29410, partial [Pseudonocardiaceae bacterium]